MYGKLINGELTYAPNIIVEDGTQIINPSEELLKAKGYKEIISVEPLDDDKYYESSYSETDTQIIQTWTESEKPVEMRIAERKAQLDESDYKIIKCYECSIVNEPLPYDIVALHNERQAIRDEINELEAQ